MKIFAFKIIINDLHGDFKSQKVQVTKVQFKVNRD